MKKILILFLGIIQACGTIYSQNRNDISLYKRIPVIRYNPVDFLAIVDDAFIHSPEYLDICFQGRDTLYVQSRFGEVKSYHDDFFKRNHINTKLFFRTDSVFILSIKSEAVSSSNLPIYRIYGVKKGGEYRFGLTNGVYEELYSFVELLKVRYGSIAKFQEIFLGYISDKLNVMGNNYNGISLYPQDKESIESFLRDDYLAHEKYNPTDTLNVLNRFVSLVASYTLLKDRQEELLRINLLKKVRSESYTCAKKRKISMLFYNEFILYGIEISSVLSIILTKQQYDDVRWGLMKHNGQRAKAMMRLDLHEESSRNVINDDSMSYYERMIKEAAMILLGGSNNKK